MTDKIQELTEKIYNEGIIKARKDAEQILSDARREAAAIIKSAKNEKESILRSATLESEELKKNTDTEIRLTARKCISSLKQEVEQMITVKQTGEPVKEALDDAELIKKVILHITEHWNPQNTEKPDLQVLLSPEMYNTLNSMFSNRAVSALQERIVLKPDDSIKNGFTIGPESGGFFIRFTDQDFENYFRTFLKEKTRSLLFDKTPGTG